MKPFKLKTLNEISDQTRAFPIVDGPFGTQLHSDEYQLQGVPLVRVTNLSFEGRFRSEDLAFISAEKAAEICRSEVLEDDIIVAKTGATIGKCGLFPFDRGIIASSCIKISVDRTKANPRFLLHRFVSPEGQTAILDGASGSTRTTINIGPFKAIVFPFPEIEEQARIAWVLDSVDEAIARTEAVIAKLKRLRAGLLHHLLTRGLDENGELRDPIAHPEQFRDSPLGRIPSVWEVRELKDCYEIPSRNGLYKKALYYGSGPRMIHMPEMFKGMTVEIANAVRVAVDSQELQRYALKEGDLLFARRSLNLEGAGLCSLVPRLEEPVTFESSIVRVRLNRALVVPQYAAEFFRSPHGYRLRLAFIRQVAVSGVSSADIGQFVLPCPEPPEQGQILALLDPHDLSLQLLGAELIKLGLLKSGLMADLLTGRVRVPENLAIPEACP
jgi:type I restriction enzyme, S subunit